MLCVSSSKIKQQMKPELGAGIHLYMYLRDIDKDLVTQVGATREGKLERLDQTMICQRTAGIIRVVCGSEVIT